MKICEHQGRRDGQSYLPTVDSMDPKVPNCLAYHFHLLRFSPLALEAYSSSIYSGSDICSSYGLIRMMGPNLACKVRI